MEHPRENPGLNIGILGNSLGKFYCIWIHGTTKIKKSIINKSCFSRIWRTDTFNTSNLLRPQSPIDEKSVKLEPRSTITVPTLCWDHTMFGEHAPVHCHVCHCRKCKTIPYHQDMYCTTVIFGFHIETEYQWILDVTTSNIIQTSSKHHQNIIKHHHLSHLSQNRIFMDTSPPKQWLQGAGVRSGGQIDGATSLIHSAKISVPSTAHQKPRVSFLLGWKIVSMLPCFFIQWRIHMLHILYSMFFGIFINYMWLKFMVHVGKSSIRS